MIVKRGNKVLNERYSELPPRLSVCGKILFKHYHLTRKPRGVLILDQGVNDSDYQCQSLIDGVQYKCPVYRIWSNMLRRTQAGGKEQQLYPTYVGTKVCAEWTSFSAFKDWSESINGKFRKEMNIPEDDTTSVWTGRHLDKDLLAGDNKLYSPNTCLFVSSQVNKFMLDSGAARGEWPIGVYFDKEKGKLKVQCSNPFTCERGHLGYFQVNQVELAVYTYQKRKHELACQSAEQLSLSPFSHDKQAAQQLMLRYPVPTTP